MFDEAWESEVDMRIGDIRYDNHARRIRYSARKYTVRRLADTIQLSVYR